MITEKHHDNFKNNIFLTPILYNSYTSQYMINFDNITLSIIKPDVVFYNKTGAINKILEENNFKIILQKKIHIKKEHAKHFYEEHKDKGFFDGLCDFLSSGPVIVQVLTNTAGETIKSYREIMGATNPAQAAEHTLRKHFAESIDYNAVHGSDSNISSEREILFFFNKTEIIDGLEDLKIKKEAIFINK